MLWILLSVLAVCSLTLLGVLLLLSPGKPQPITDENGRIMPGSLSEKISVEINGVPQAMFIKSRDPRNPVLLYLHGGMPDYFLTGQYPTGLETLFTVVWWEQRGSGMSYNSSIPKETITEAQLISDTLALTDYLRQRFGQDKIYLMGHSGGTFFGIQAAAQAPERYHAYIGVAQISDQLESEKLAYDFMLQEFQKQGNTQWVKKLQAAPVSLESGLSPEYLALRDPAMHSLGVGTTHDMRSILTGIFLPSLTFREYSLLDKLNLWRAKARNGVSVIWQTSLETDLRQKTTRLDIPVYFFAGAYDYTCNTTLAKDYFEKIQAPVKGFYTFQNSAHSPIFEEPEKSLQILRQDVLNGANNLADPD